MPGRNKTEEKNVHANLDLKKLAECRECTCFNLRKATRVVTQVYDDAMRPTGLRATQFALLAHTYAMGPVPLRKLAEAMVTDRTTLARNLEPLEKEGLLSIEDGEDRRSRIISITEYGLKKFAEAYPVWKRTQDEVKKIMGEGEWSEMISKVSMMADRLRDK
jgi:DNA-binding MarR family transcriptional regulator